VNCWPDLQDAIDHAAAGGTVVVYGNDGTTSGSGVFDENIVFTDTNNNYPHTPLTLEMERGTVTINSIDETDPGGAIVLNGVDLQIGDTGDTTSNPDSAIDGLITGTGHLLKQTAATLIVGGIDDVTAPDAPNPANQVDGGIMVASGSINGGVIVQNSGSRLVLGSGSALQYSAVTIDAFHGLDTSAYFNAYLGSLDGNGDLDLTFTNLYVGGDDRANKTYSGTLTASQGGALIKVGNQTLTMSGDNSAAPIFVDNGELMPGVSDALARSTVTVVQDLPLAGYLYCPLPSTTIGALAGDGTVEAYNAFQNTSDLIVGGNNASTTFSGIFSVSGALVKQGSGTMTLTTDASVGGPTTVSQGALALGDQFGARGILTSGGTVTVGSGATLYGPGTINGAVVVNGGALEAGPPVALYPVPGVLRP
jgi:autotransporter-associated beta strand protein